MTREPLRVAIAGSSAITERHLRTIRRLPAVELVGLHGSHREAVGALASRHGLAVHDSLERLLAQGPDWLVVTNSTERHAETVAAALPSVPNLLVEKPLAPNLADARALVRAAGRYGARLFVVSQLRFDSGLERFRGFAGAAGRLRVAIRVRKHRDARYYRGDRSLSKALPFSQLPHYLDLAMELLGPDLEVEAAAAENRSGWSCFGDRLELRLRGPRGSADLTIDTASPRSGPFELELEAGGRLVRARDLSVRYDSAASWLRNLAGRWRRTLPIDPDLAFLRMYEDMLERADRNEPDDRDRVLRSAALIERAIEVSGYDFGPAAPQRAPRLSPGEAPAAVRDQ